MTKDTIELLEHLKESEFLISLHCFEERGDKDPIGAAAIERCSALYGKSEPIPAEWDRENGNLFPEEFPLAVSDPDFDPFAGDGDERKEWQTGARA
jgi:hypothetical protein